MAGTGAAGPLGASTVNVLAPLCKRGKGGPGDPEPGAGATLSTGGAEGATEIVGATGTARSGGAM